MELGGCDANTRADKGRFYLASRPMKLHKRGLECKSRPLEV